MVHTINQTRRFCSIYYHHPILNRSQVACHADLQPREFINQSLMNSRNQHGRFIVHLMYFSKQV